MTSHLSRRPWRCLATAPKDGMPVVVYDPDCGAFLMKWDDDFVNPLVNNPPGIWIAVDGSFTWDVSRDAGPTKWLPRDEYHRLVPGTLN